MLVHQLIADQIAEDDPPGVWRNARRLLDSGLEAKSVMSNLVMAGNAALVAALHSDEPFDGERYIEELDRLPLPPVGEMFKAFVAIARERGSVTSDELIARTLASFSDGAEVTGSGGTLNSGSTWPSITTSR